MGLGNSPCCQNVVKACGTATLLGLPVGLLLLAIRSACLAVVRSACLAVVRSACLAVVFLPESRANISSDFCTFFNALANVLLNWLLPGLFVRGQPSGHVSGYLSATDTNSTRAWCSLCAAYWGCICVPLELDNGVALR